MEKNKTEETNMDTANFVRSYFIYLFSTQSAPVTMSIGAVDATTEAADSQTIHTVNGSV